MRFPFLFFLCGLSCALLRAQTAKQPLDYVNPFIGTDAHGHTYPGATAPFGMVQLSPDTRLEGWDGCSGYHFSDSLIYGFSHTHLSGTGVPDYCDILIMPYTGAAAMEKNEYRSAFRKSKEHAEAGYYAVFLDKNNIKVELTATERVGVHRYTFPKNRERGKFIIDLRHRDQVLESSMSTLSDREIAGHRVSKAWAEEQHIYFAIRFSKPFAASKIIDMTQSPRLSQRTVNSKAIVDVLEFYPEGEPIVVTVGLSAVSVEAARHNLDAECPHFDFDRVKSETQAKWARQLGKIEVEGGTEAQKTTFYTALYHTMIAPNIYNDADGQYRGRDMKIHSTNNHDVYTVFSLWDTYRACNPLYTLLEPKRTNDFIQTFLRQYEQGGLLPVWELGACETNCMIGNHAIPVIADAWLKGIRNYDGRLALKAMMKSANEDRLGLKFYKSMGYIPSDEEPEAVSKTLEYAFDDWCIAQMAKSLGQKETYDLFIRRAQHYKNVFDPSTGFFRAKNNNTWHTPFDPAEVNFNYTEANAWQYRFAAPQDVSGMIALMGGNVRFGQQLDSLFQAHPKTTGRQQADITGLIGQYAHGNEPSHHIAYLYNYAAQPWKTQKQVRQILDEQYSDRPDGLSGNEDCGQMSAWYVWSALGLYPVVPGSAQYVIGTPLFEKATLHLDGNQTFVIRAPGASAKNCYIQNARLDGKPFNKSWLTHEVLSKNGALDFEMGDKPSRWASAEADCPVSVIDDKPIVPVPFVAAGARVFQKTETVALGCLDPAAVIHYTLDGAEPSVSSPVYEKPISLERSAHLRFVAIRNEKHRSPIVEADFSKLQANLKVLKYNTAYNPQYTGRGDNGLVDLLRGGADFRSGGWQGYEGVNLDVVLDMDSVKEVKRLVVNFLQDENAWIFFPGKVLYAISDDGVHFQPLGEVSNTVPPLEKGTLQQAFTLMPDKSRARGRYLRVIGVSLGQCPANHKGAGNPCWVFADEILVE